MEQSNEEDGFIYIKEFSSILREVLTLKPFFFFCSNPSSSSIRFLSSNLSITSAGSGLISLQSSPVAHHLPFPRPEGRARVDGVTEVPRGAVEIPRSTAAPLLRHRHRSHESVRPRCLLDPRCSSPSTSPSSHEGIRPRCLPDARLLLLRLNCYDRCEIPNPPTDGCLRSLVAADGNRRCQGVCPRSWCFAGEPNYPTWRLAMINALHANNKYAFISGSLGQPSDNSSDLESWMSVMPWLYLGFLIPWLLSYMIV
uniref:Uncharacterized protein LOC105043227 n=1 Tax=Elaeis guineensis var. tenera TaxID=51953 RepID=A0A6I9R7R6_ELAGV|nr:uncharacterized protein LOC105043227 [Elaeis guineensis]